MDYQTRELWQARPPRRRSLGNLNDKNTLHWNGPKVTVGGKTTWDHSKCPGLVRGIQNFHMDAPDHLWSDIAYNFIVCPHGTVFEGRGLNVINAANGTNVGNKTSHTIMVLSGQGNPFLDSEKAGILMASQFIDQHTDAPSKLKGHRDWHQTACPGDERYSWLTTAVLGGVGPSIPAPVPAPAPVSPTSFGLWPLNKNKPVVKHGSTGDAVRYLQRVIYLKAGGNIVVDGVFGNDTEKRVKNVQSLFKVTADGAGVVGAKTWAVIDYLTHP